MTIKDLKPALIWDLFDQITKVPRPSKHEEKMTEFLVNFAKEHNIEYKADAAGNVACSVLLPKDTKMRLE